MMIVVIVENDIDDDAGGGGQLVFSMGQCLSPPKWTTTKGQKGLRYFQQTSTASSLSLTASFLVVQN